jgi:hypothetical protein
MWLSKAEKLMARLLSKPADFSFTELKSVLAFFGYKQIVAGKTGGSRVAFSNSDGDYIRLHKPHPRNELKAYQIEDIITALKERGLI